MSLKGMRKSRAFGVIAGIMGLAAGLAVPAAWAGRPDLRPDLRPVAHLSPAPSRALARPGFLPGWWRVGQIIGRWGAHLSDRPGLLDPGLSGSPWRGGAAPNPALPHRGVFATSRPPAGACVAAGLSATRTGKLVTLAEAWNGTSWRIQPTQDPAGSHGSELVAVSCRSPGACTAAGDYVTGANVDATLAERWNGTRWAIQAPHNTPRSASPPRTSHSCPSSHATTADRRPDSE